MIKLADAIVSLAPNSEWKIFGDDITWLSSTHPTVDEVIAEQSRLQSEYDNNLFQRQRATAYPSMQEQADMQYWDSVNGTTTWQDAIALVKSTYPKGGS
jgi:hypothetical protein